MSDPGPTVYNGRYELHRRLGRGGMAEVYLARDQLLDRPVAVKVLFPEFATDPSFVERFRREAQAAANLNHPNIVGVYDWGEASGTYFIVMEYVDGRTLSEILRSDGPLHPDRAADVAADVAAGLGFAHRNGVVHRDIKPGNVLITQSGQVKVADFGIARAIAAGAEENLTQTGAVMGTATYFSPEQAQGAAVDPRSDLYSLGVVIYEMLTGKPPFAGDSPVAIAYKHVQESPVPPRQANPGIPQAMEAIVLKCLAKNPVNRYPSAEDLRADLRRFREGAHILAEPVMVPPVDPGATNMMAPTSATAAYDGGTRMAPADDLPREYRDEQRSGAFLVVLVLLLIVLGALLFLLARTLGIGSGDSGNVAQVAVPNVIDKPAEEARTILEGQGFKVDTTFEQNEDKPENIVFAQDPAAGIKKDKGSTVVLKVSSGAQLIKVPDVTGSQLEEARRLLESEGFVVEVQESPDEKADPGEVVDQDPAGGGDAPKGSTVRIIVSSGAAERAVPDVSGRTVGEATALLTEAGFKTVQKNDASSTVEAGKVIGSDPPAGTMLAKDETVTIIVSTGAEQATVPTVEGLSKATAENQLTNAGFTVKVVEETVPPGDPRDGRVISQSPGGNTKADKGSQVTIVVGKASIGPTTTTA
jgi:serine/threonine-protein kinase